MRAKYPHILLRTDYAAGIKMTIGQARKHKAMQGGMRSWPDLQLAHPAGQYHGLFIELKKDGVKILRDKDARKVLADDYKLRLAGDWWDLHTEEQGELLAKLRAAGYAATFAVGTRQAEQYIDMYMAGQAVPYLTPTVTAAAPAHPF